MTESVRSGRTLEDAVPPRPTSWVRWVQAALFVAGLFAFAWLLASAGLEPLWEQTRRLGWAGVAAIVAFGGLDQLFHALGWQRCFPGPVPALRPLLAAHLAGNAVNLVTPTATVGGEFVRATLLPASAFRSDAVAALTVDRLTFAVSDALFSLCGVVVLLRAPGLEPAARLSLAAGIGLVILGIAIFLVLQRSGRIVAVVTESRWLARIAGPRLAETLRSAGGGVDRRIALLHAERAGALRASTALHGVGNLMLVGQLACLVGFTGTEVTLGGLLQIFAVVTALDLASFFVPGRLGAQEGARMLAVTLAGLPIELGLLFSLAQRFDQFVWTAVGFVAYSRRLAPRQVSSVDRG